MTIPPPIPNKPESRPAMEPIPSPASIEISGDITGMLAEEVNPEHNQIKSSEQGNQSAAQYSRRAFF